MDDDWIDITTVQSEFEVQFNMATGAYRYRPMSLNRYAKSRVFEVDNYGIEDWKPGHPDEQRRKQYERSQLAKWDTKPAKHEEWD